MLAGSAAAQASFTPTWSSYVGSDYDADGVYAIAADGATNSYIGGYIGLGGAIQNNLAVGVTDPYYYQGAQDGFVAKLTPGGSLAWYICLGDVENDRVTGLATGPDDRLYAAGYAERTDTLNEDGGTNACLWAVNRSTGANDWTIALGAFNRASAFNAVAADADGYVYAVGYTAVTGLSQNVAGYVAGGTLYGTQLMGETDACVVKVAPDGAVVWFHYLGGTNADAATACAVTADGSVYVAGETRSPGWVSTASGAPGAANKDGFLVKLTADGAHVWSTFLGGNGSDAVAALSANSATRTLLAGGSTASADFLSGTARLNAFSGGASDGFVTKLTDNGAAFSYAWTRFLGSNAADRVSSLALLPNGQSVAGGATASGEWLPLAGGSAFRGVQDGFLCGLDSAGAVTASAYVGGANGDEVRALAAVPRAILTAGSTFSGGWMSEDTFWNYWNKGEGWDGTIVYDVPFGFVGQWWSEPGEPPTITVQPADVTVQEGDPAAFAVAATGFKPFTYRWYRNGEAVAGPASNLYALASAAVTNHNDTYACLISNAFGTSTSQVARLTVIPKGTLAVTLSPAAAAAQGARWSLDNGATWLGGGSTNLTAGAYSVTFASLAGWNAPAALAGVQVASGATTALDGVYTAILPAAARSVAGTNVTVLVQAPAGLSAWTLVEALAPGLTPFDISAGGIWDSGARTLTFTGTEATTGTVSYAVICAASGAYAISGTVTPQPANVPVAVSGDAQVIRANFIRKVTGRTVTITVNQPLTTVRWQVYEYLPAGLTPDNVTGPFMGFDAGEMYWFKNKGVGETLTFEVTGEPGTYALSGEGQIGTGAFEPIFGDDVLVIPAAEVPPPDILGFAAVPGSAAFQLTFTSVEGQAYQVQTNAALNAASWADAFSVTGSGSETMTLVPQSAPRLFYRVRVVQ